MGRYRVSLILAMPEFDTAGTIRRFAKDPKNLGNKQAWRFLQRRARLSVSWDGFRAGGVDNMELLSQMRLGAYTSVNDTISSGPSGNDITTDKILEMDPKERDDWFIRICDSVGVKVDPEALINARKGTQQ